MENKRKYENWSCITIITLSRQCYTGKITSAGEKWIELTVEDTEDRIKLRKDDIDVVINNYWIPQMDEDIFMKDFFIYYDTEMDEFKTLFDIKKESYDFPEKTYKELQYTVLTSMITSNGGKYEVLTTGNSIEFKLALAINKILSDFNLNSGQYFDDSEQQKNVVKIMDTIKHKDKKLCVEYEKLLRKYKQSGMARKLHAMVFNIQNRKHRKRAIR